MCNLTFYFIRYNHIAIKMNYNVECINSCITNTEYRFENAYAPELGFNITFEHYDLYLFLVG